MTEKGIEARALEAEGLLQEALREYTDHQSWRCEHKDASYYLAAGSPDDPCPCGLDEFTERAEAFLNHKEEK
jgi:hypothetical protein